MKTGKGSLTRLVAAILCLSLTACGGGGSSDAQDDPDVIEGNDWRVTGIARDAGIITCDGTDTFVLVCINADSADFFLDEEVQTLYGYVDYPIPLQSDPWEAFEDIDFADRNGDGNSDVAIRFELDGQQTRMVWFWDTDTEEFVFQSEGSQLAAELTR